MYATKDKNGHKKVSLTLKFKVNCQGQVIDFVFFEIHDLENIRIDTEILSVPYIQPAIWKVIIVYMYDLEFEGQRHVMAQLSCHKLLIISGSILISIFSRNFERVNLRTV